MERRLPQIARVTDMAVVAVIAVLVLLLLIVSLTPPPDAHPGENG